jgi:hypothetical protein
MAKQSSVPAQVSSSSYKVTSAIMGAPPSCPHLILMNMKHEFVNEFSNMDF